jgi:hypothetical protein
MKLPQEGSCRCGRVKLRISKPPLLSMACHCTGCQKMSSSAFSLSVAIPTDGFEVVEGEPVVGGLHGDDAYHMFCGYCMSWMFTRVEQLPWFVNVRTSMLEGAADFPPYVETWTSEGFAWAKTGAKHSYPKLPEMQDFDWLTKEYLAQAA